MNRFLFLLLSIGFIDAAIAQRMCGTDIYYNNQIKQNPEILQKEIAWNEEAAKPILSKRATKYIIPVVFHVIHLNGEENVSREQILDQIRVLNEDFSLNNPNKSNIRSAFSGLAQDCEIEFRLAQVDPNGNCTDGINRIYSTYTNNSSQTNEEIKYLSNTHWNYLKYLNVYVVTSIQSSSSTTGLLLGYAVFPWATSSLLDGIVMRHDRLGTIGTAAVTGDGGRTLTHEIGHWLGLFHTFQNGCVSQNDGCDDTPPVAETFTNANCPATGNSCTNESPDKLDMWENYMDYSEGTCMSMFTSCQKTRMHNQLTSSTGVRKGLWTSTNLVATGVSKGNTSPQASIGSNTQVVCVGKNVTYYDNSCKATVVSRTWTFAGGSPSNSSAANPVIVYNTPGKYQVKLQVINTNGQNEVIKNDYITVESQNGLNPQYAETFENSNAITVKNSNTTSPPWKIYNAGNLSNTCYYADVVNAAEGEIFSLTLPGINLKTLKNKAPQLSFYTAYAPNSAASQSEVMRISISTDCGKTYKQLFQRLGAGLYYAGAQSTVNFAPTANNQWKLIKIALSDYDTFTNATLRIDLEANAGNAVYIDNINVGSWIAGINDISNIGLKLYPNPAVSAINIEINKEILISKVTINNLAGQLISSQNGNNTNTLSIKNTQNLKGLYLVNVYTNKGISTTRVEFE